MTPEVSIIVPVKNEAPNIAPLIQEIEQALTGRWEFEILYVNDGSTDGTLEALRAMMCEKPFLRCLSHDISGGQSMAVRTGVRAAFAPIVATLDGDGQNNPAFLPEMITLLLNTPAAGLVAGQRVGRKDGAFKSWQSRIANGVREAVLHDGTRDTGCGLKAFRRDVFLSLPFFSGVHRFLPALVRREGFEVRHLDVVDRPRRAGVSNYGMFDRLGVGIADLLGVWWLTQRYRTQPKVTEEISHAD